MSTHNEIMEVYGEDIESMSKLVESKFGKAPFYNNFQGFSIENIYDKLGIEKIVCSDFTPKTKTWQKKYLKSVEA